MAKWGKLTDDRGRPVPRYDPQSRAISAEDRSQFPQASFERVRESLSHRAGCLSNALLVCMVLGMVGSTLVFGATLARGQFSGRDLAQTLFNLTSVALAWIGYRWGFPVSDARAFRSAMLAEGRCPSCAYPLADVPAAPDGCAVCPECGAAWLTNRASI